MADRQWTDAQSQAIGHENGALLVSAAAGSGKTAVLVERAVRLITRAEAPVPADRLLILTFTNAAAEELRGRIAARLQDELLAAPASLALRRQRLLLKRAFIGTIDAFCQQLVKEHFTLLDIAPDVTVGDAALLAQLSEAALAEAMEAAYQNESFGRFAALYGRARSDADAADTILALYRFTRTLPNPDAQLDRLAEMYAAGAPLAQTAWGRELLDYAETALAEAAELAAEALGVARASATCGAYAAALQSDAEAISTMLAAVKAGDWDGAAELVGGYAFPALKAVRGADEGDKNRVKAARDTIKNILGSLQKYCFACTLAEYDEDLETARPMVKALIEAVKLYADYYWQAKQAERVCDFSDFEHLALALLQTEDGSRSALAEQVSARYDAVMVDEYQDTNELQSALYECLAAPGGENLFYVGDVKQCIYRFRQSNPGIFMAKKLGWAPYGSGSPAVLGLGHNFRSAQGVVEGVNTLFGQLMSRALGEVDYGEDEKLIYAAAYSAPGGVELDLIESEDEADEADFVARRIAQMVAEGWPVEEKGQTRPAGYGDFCILLRAKTRMPQFMAALAAHGVPAVADRADELLQTPEVLPLAAALCAIDNPGDDVNLAAAMLGPLFRFTPDEVTALRAAAPKGRLWGAVCADENEKTRRFVRHLLFYRSLAQEMSVGRLCEELAARTGYLAAVAAMASGAVRRENVQRFIGWAAEVSGAGRGGLAAFARMLAAGRAPEAPAAKTVPGHVAVLTVHKSKGLEFPAVFLCDAARPFNHRELSARVQLHPALGIGLALRAGDSIYRTLPALAIRSRLAKESQSEEMRVLYVALTRAKQRAFVTFAHNDAARLLMAKLPGCYRQTLSPFALGSEHNMAAWLLSAVVRHECAAAVLQQKTGLAPPALLSGGGLRFEVAEPQSAAQAEAEAYELTAAPDAELATLLRQNFNRQPPRAALWQVPAKLSVSAIAKAPDDKLRQRPSFMYKQGLTAAERGTAQHAFMQFADFAAAQKDPAAELDRLVREAYISEETAAAVDKSGVAAFLASPLARRMAAAQTVLREYDFIVALPAGQIQPGLPPELADEAVMVQGIADLVLVSESGIEIADYKTDRDTDAETLRQRYAAQLGLYRLAVQRRLGLPVTRLTLWSFSLAAEVALPLQAEDEAPGEASFSTGGG